MTGTEHRDPLVRTSPRFPNNSDVFGDYTATFIGECVQVSLVAPPLH